MIPRRRKVASWDPGGVRGTGQVARLVGVAAIMLVALLSVALTARSDRGSTLTEVTPSPGIPTNTYLPTDDAPVPDGGQGDPQQDSRAELPTGLLLLIIAMMVLPGLFALVYFAPLARLPRLRKVRRKPRPPDGRPDPLPDEVPAGPLAAAVADGLRELDQGGPGEGVLASWVLLERAAAEAGTHRAAPDTPSELAGRLIDRHGVSSGPLLRLAELYREARYSTHEVPESARGEARAALEQLRAELDANPVGGRR